LKRVAVLISGRGSNLGALIAAQDANYKIILVISNVEGAGGLEKAQAAGIATAVIPHTHANDLFCRKQINEISQH